MRPMTRRIALIDGHPDENPTRLIHALVEAYSAGAHSRDHAVRRVNISELDFPLIGSTYDWHGTYVPSDIRHAQQAILWASHIVIFYPLWLGDMPALLKGFLEQVMRPGFALDEQARPEHAGLLDGRSARIVVTMGMPASIYRDHFGAHSIKSLEHNLLRFVGISPVESNLYGQADGGPADCAAWLAEMRAFGAKAA